MKTAKKTLAPEAAPQLDYALLNRITSRAFYMALEMIYAANHRPEIEKEKGEPKVGGHPSACASSQHILAAIHLVMKKPEDYMANKPHVSPMDHALNFLLHCFKEKDGSWMPADRRKIAMRHLRHYSKEGLPVFQSYHAEADPDGYRFFPSGSVGIPPVNALYTALAYDYASYHGFEVEEDPTFWCLMGDSEFREGSLHEAMPDAGERELKRLIWIVDYNRQNLDGTRITNEKALGGSDADRIVKLAEANGWNGVKLKHGKIRERLFATPGGEEFKRVLDEELSDFEFQSLIGNGKTEVIMERLEKKSTKLKAWMKNHSPETIREAFFNLAGHDLECLVEAFTRAKQSDKPTLIVPYTIKGFTLECQAMSGNHSAMPEREELDKYATRLGMSPQDPFSEFPKNSPEETFLAERRKTLQTGIDSVIENANARRKQWADKAKSVSWPVDFDITALKLSPIAHTQWMWGQIAAKLDRLARGDAGVGTQKGSGTAYDAFSKLFLTMAPDVGSSTNTSPNMNGKLFGGAQQEDFETLFDTKDKKAPDVMPKLSERSGHLRFEIAEGNCMSAAGSFGKFGYFTGIPFYPAMPVYDFFIKRALDQMYYNCYWHSSFATIGTPSGVTLAAEGAQHSWKSDIQMPNQITWEPCFAKEVDWILADTLRRHFTGENADREACLLRCVTKGIVQKEMLTRLRRQARFKSDSSGLSFGSEDSACISDEEILETVRKEVLEGGYPLIDYRGYSEYVPGDNAVHLFAMGALVPEAIKASDRLREEKGICANVFVVTSPDLLLGNYAYHQNYRHVKHGLGINGAMHFVPGRGKAIESLGDWYALQGGRVPVVSVHDGEPGLLDNIGSIVGVQHRSLAVRKTSKSGTTWDIYHLHGIDSEGVFEAALATLADASQETFEVNRSVLQSIQP
jgi:pyruvate dehydrogenase E1 component